MTSGLGSVLASPVVARPVAAAMGALARLRHGPAIHAVGTSYAARLDVHGATDGERTGLDLLDEPTSRPAVVRLSRGAGLPIALPDVLGLAVRLQGPEGPQDLLLDSCWGGPLGRHLVRLGRSASGGVYGSLLSYRVGDRTVHLAAAAAASDQDRTTAHDAAVGERFRLLVAAPYERRWRHWADLHLLEPVERPALRFSPAHDGLGVRLRLDGTRFRTPSYHASQRQGPFTQVRDRSTVRS
jgi:hypothetical protein